MWHANTILPGVQKFLGWLNQENKQYLFLTNASDITPTQLSKKMERLTGREIPPQNFYTSALATASFVSSQTPGANVYAVGTQALTSALEEAGCTISDQNVDYVVVGETKEYNFSMIETAVKQIRRGAKLIGTNKDIFDRVGGDVVPSTGTLVAPIEMITGKKAYFIGKPNPLIMSYAMDTLQTKRIDTVIIGDRMDTDIVAGLELGIDSVLVLSGVTTMEDLNGFSYKPTVILDGIKDILD
eukprot:TRINITY_DN3756_c0_g1_i3.p1 TRINITY_DN3756_c0_g1~~TRINITY_DN3756_c0_g1_i3.p1  ORF type:complete len:242 (-),score=60.06 TRINITY_DN3756_c0_g1_i3:30-755(-)